MRHPGVLPPGDREPGLPQLRAESRLTVFGPNENPRPVDHALLHSSAIGGAVNVALAELRRRGQRVTAPRRAVVEALAAHPDQLTAEQVLALLDGLGIHRATVYRTLELLAATGVVSRRQAPGGPTRYHLAATGPGQEHLHGHCRRCGTVVALPPNALDAVGGRLFRDTGFLIDAWQTTLVGLCGPCARGEVPRPMGGRRILRRREDGTGTAGQQWGGAPVT